MSTIKFKRFTKPQLLKSIGRGLLGQLFGSYVDDLGAADKTLPSQDSNDEEL